MSNSDLRLHVHNDIELLTMYPLVFTHGAEAYVMQENRVVYIGRLDGLDEWVSVHEGTYCNDIYLKPKANTEEKHDDG